MRRMKNKFEQNIRNEQEKRKKNYGDTVVEFDEKEQDKKDKDFGGEYVDFKELDKEWKRYIYTSFILYYLLP